jgi:hypothetical protein
MGFDAAGNFSRAYNYTQDRDNGIKILASHVDGEFDNFATAMNLVFFRDGRVPMSADLRLNINGIQGLKDGALGSPAIKFNTDANTGPYLDGLSRYAIGVNAVQRGVFTTTGFDVTGVLSQGGAPVATQAFVTGTYAPLASPALTGVPTAPTAATGTSTTQLASTAFVQNAVAAFVPVTGGTFSGAVTMGGGATVGFNISPGTILAINSASGQVRGLQFQTAGVFAADIQLQADNSTIKHNSGSGHRFDVAGSQRVVFDATGLTVISGNQQVTLNNGSNVAKAYIGTNALFGSAGTDDLRIRSEASNIVFGFTGSEIARFTAGDGFALSSNNSNLKFTDANGSTPKFICQSDNTFAFYGTDAGGSARPIWSAPMRSSSGAFTIYPNVSMVGTLTVDDITTKRAGSPTTGAVFFGNSGAKYLFYDGSQFNLSASLSVGGNITSTSDARLKSNVRDLENGLALVKAMRARRFTMYGKPDLGLVAQELEPLMPEVVNRDSKGMLSVDYGRLVTPLIAAVQSLSDRLDRAGL